MDTSISKDREVNYDFLRSLCTFVVILLHVNSRFGSERSQTDSLEAIVVHSLCVFGVPCFVMLSGAFLLNDKRNTNVLWFYRKSFLNVFLPTLIISVLYSGYNLIYYIRNDYTGIDAIWKLFIDFLHGSPFYHLWYMYMIVILYLSVPFVIKLKEHISQRAYFLLMILTFVLGVAIAAYWESDFEWGVNSIKYFGFLLSGDIIYKNKEKICMGLKRFGCVILAAMLLIVLALSWLRCIEVRDNITLFPMSIFSSLNPIIIIFAVLVFISFTRMQLKCSHSKLRECIISFAKDSYWIYLLHAIIIELLVKVSGMFGGYSGIRYVVLVLLISFVTVFITWLLAHAIANLYKKVLRMTCRSNI